MSIWVSLPIIGHPGPMDAFEERRGDVRSYATGWSNHYPDHTVEHDSRIDLALIPVWCVPGHRESTSTTLVGPWLRLGVDTRTHDFHDPTGPTSPVYVSVVMDEEAVRALRDDLTDWLHRPKAHPATPTEAQT